jgi:2-methylcitrate dehydratase PrpD
MNVPEKTYLSAEIGRFGANLRFEDLPAGVVEKLKICLYFNLGIAIAGAPLVRDGVAAVSLFPLAAGTGARLFLEGTELPPTEAAFANAIMMHARAQDDFQHCANAHIGTVAIPAALALGDWLGADGRTLLAAIAIAYQVATILGDGFAAITTPRGFRASGIYSTPGAAAGCARMLGLNEHKAGHAVGLAASFAAAIGQPWVAGSMEWRLQIGQASRNAVACALLAKAGCDAALDAYEGRYGFYAAHAQADVDVEAMVASLRGPWRTDTIAFKPLPLCAINQGPAVNAMEVRRTLAIAPEEIARVEIQLPDDEAAYPGIAATGPIASAGSALMRTAYVVAVCLVNGRLCYDDLEKRDNKTILALAELASVVGRRDLSPLSHMLKITTRDGRVFDRPHQVTGREFILDRDEIRKIFDSISDELALPMQRIDALADVVWRLDRDATPADIVSTLQRQPASRRVLVRDGGANSRGIAVHAEIAARGVT